ncbi:hypothetical protein Syun_003895 [Stephania yunnanensis]|uniref:Reverse transcriptase domain-containing protein n=1 Tax=Stephania yunnanensis TaxID=152371 RepID=A0AAP0L3F2_9MAGN
MSMMSSDVLLRMKWLFSLGFSTTDWPSLTLSFTSGGRQHSIKGDPNLYRALISCKSVQKAWASDMGCFLIEFCHVAMDFESTEEEVVEPCIRELLDSFLPLFQLPTNLPPVRACDHAIILREGTDPVRARPYRYPHIPKSEIEALVSEMLAVGIIQPSSSPFSSHILLVKKKDGSWQFCIDYRTLNKVTVPNRFPIPNIDELLDELHCATIFWKLYLLSCYHQIRVCPQDVHKTAFRMHECHYKFLVMSFGLSNASTTLQALMNSIFKGLLRRFVLVFFDDILVYNTSLATHVEHLSQVLSIFFAHSLFVNFKKCCFAKSQLDYLGHVISGEAIMADPGKVKAMDG